MSPTQRSTTPTQRSEVPLTCDDVTADTHDPDTTLGFDLTVNEWGHAAHAHDWAQLVHAINGRATFDIHDVDGRVVATHSIDTSSAIWIPPMVWHSARFEPGFVPSAHCLDLDASETAVRMLVIDATVRAELLATQWRPDETLAATRATIAAQGPFGSTPPPRPAGPTCGRIADVLDADPADERDLAAWARDLHTSTATIRRAFKAETGLTYSRWRTRHRLHAAVTLLRGGGSPSHVAAAVGYSDAGLAAAVRRELNCTPSDLTP